MAQDWVAFVKQVQAQYGCSYGEAMKLASALRKKKAGAVWKLTPEQQQRYIQDKKEGKNMQNMGSYTIWKG